jgi:two-component system response regulator AtoC
LPENQTETVRLLIVSREPAVLRPLWSMAEAHAWHIESAVSAWDAMERVQSGVAPHLLLLDLPRGDSDSLHILRWMRRLRPDLPVVVLCYAEDAGRKIEATRLGAQEVLVRPFEEAKLEAVIRRYLVAMEDSPEMASEDIEPLGLGEFFVSAGPITQKLRAQAELLAEADVPVLILGEQGSGKDTVARLIHKMSIRSGFKFLKVNCADMPAELLEAELFGRGHSSSTHNSSIHNQSHASHQAAGKFERAERGTLFLDEIAEMPLALQGRLMQVLQEKQLRHAGREHAARVDVRVLAATGSNIERALAEGKLREDLYYRLSAFTVQVPPLRQRRMEIAVLLRHLMHKLARHYNLPAREFSAAVLDACQRHSWPGNLIELEAFVKRYLVSGEQQLSFGDPEGTAGHAGNGRHSSSEPFGLHASTRASSMLEPSPRQAAILHDSLLQPAPHASRTGSEAHRGNGTEVSLPKSLKSLLQSVKSEAERNAIATALHKTGWNRKAAARLLQVSYRTLLYKIEQYQMSVADPLLQPSARERYSLDGYRMEEATVKGNGNGKAS